MGIKTFLFWLPMIVIAFANAMLREFVIIKHYTEFRAQQLSTVTLLLFCSIYIGLIYPYLDIKTTKQAFIIGSFWVIMTVAFEFILGRLTNKSWEYLFQNYYLFTGRLWLLFLLCLLVLPYIFYSIRNR